MYNLPKNMFKTLFSLYDSSSPNDILLDITTEGIYFGTPYIVGYVVFNATRGKPTPDVMFSFSRKGHFNRACNSIIFDDKALELTVDGQAIEPIGLFTGKIDSHARDIWHRLNNNRRNTELKASYVSVKLLDKVMKVLKLFKVERAYFTRFYGVEGCGPYIARGDSADGRYSVNVLYMPIVDKN